MFGSQKDTQGEKTVAFRCQIKSETNVLSIVKRTCLLQQSDTYEHPMQEHQACCRESFDNADEIRRKPTGWTLGSSEWRKHDLCSYYASTHRMCSTIAGATSVACILALGTIWLRRARGGSVGRSVNICDVKRLQGETCTVTTSEPF